MMLGVSSHNTSLLVPSSWPLSGFELYCYNSSYPIPYSTFLELNSASHSMYVPYSSCNDISICVQKGFIINTEINNPHYFEETCFNLFESHAYLLIWSHVLRQTQKKHSSKMEWSDYWLAQYGIGRRKKFTRWLGGTKPPVVISSGSKPKSSLSSFSLVSHLYKMFVPDNIFSDLFL